MREYRFEATPQPVDPVEIAAHMWGTPSQEGAQQEADQLLAMLTAAGLTPDEIVDYLRNASWRVGGEGRGR